MSGLVKLYNKYVQASISGLTASGSLPWTRPATTSGAREEVTSDYDECRITQNLISVPFVPAMSPVEADHNPFEGEEEWRLVWDRAPALCAMNVLLIYLIVSRLPGLLLRPWADSWQTMRVREEHIKQLKSIILCVENTSAFNLNTPAPRRNKFSPKSQSDYFYSFDKIFIIPLIPLWYRIRKPKYLLYFNMYSHVIILCINMSSN